MYFIEGHTSYYIVSKLIYVLFLNDLGGQIVNNVRGGLVLAEFTIKIQ